MTTKPYESIVETLIDESSLSGLINEAEECFYLDYKQASADYTNSRSIKGSDLDNIAKSISGFGNALGGILIFGVDNKKNLLPFKGYKNFETLVQETISRSTNPHHEYVETKSISSSDTESGYVIIIIHQSHNRPLQVITNSNNHRYFYRTGESHVDIPHDVLVGMMGQKIPVKLSYQIGKKNETTDAFVFDILIRNNSSVIARDVWFNIDIGIPTVTVLQSASSNLFTGHTIANSMSVIAIKDFRLPPQGYVAPICISIPKKILDINKEYHLYFTFGCDGSKMYEFKAQFMGCDYNEKINGGFEDFISFIKSRSLGHVTERV